METEIQNANSSDTYKTTFEYCHASVNLDNDFYLEDGNAYRQF